jgi:hypothetical protein
MAELNLRHLTEDELLKLAQHRVSLGFYPKGSDKGDVIRGYITWYKKRIALLDNAPFTDDGKTIYFVTKAEKGLE